MKNKQLKFILPEIIITEIENNEIILTSVFEKSDYLDWGNNDEELF